MTVHATNPPSLVVIVDETSELKLDEGDLARDRIDLICDLDGEIIAVKGHVGNGAEAMFPKVPKPPAGSKVVAQVLVKAGDKEIYETAITNFNEGVTVSGENGFTVDPALVLDPFDPFDKLLIALRDKQRLKRQDYATSGNLFANFDRTAAMLNIPGFGGLDACLAMVAEKFGRITNLRGRSARNEPVMDSFQDLATCAILALGLYEREVERPILNREIER